MINDLFAHTQVQSSTEKDYDEEKYCIWTSLIQSNATKIPCTQSPSPHLYLPALYGKVIHIKLLICLPITSDNSDATLTWCIVWYCWCKNWSVSTVISRTSHPRCKKMRSCQPVASACVDEGFQDQFCQRRTSPVKWLLYPRANNGTASIRH